MIAEKQSRWNHNIHYHRLILDAVPGHACTALDVGTGNGLLAVDLRQKVPAVTGIDREETVLESARQEHDDIDWVLGDVMEYPFTGTFDVVASVATLHHMLDLHATLRRLAELTSPGGVLVIVGLARPTRPADFALDLVGVVQHRWLSWRRNYWEHSAPTVWPPPHSYAEVRRCAAAQLPGMYWRKLPMFRYALTWHKPGTLATSFK
ncbi:methyltransferase family protein [Rhodococcus sp. OK302]|nr:class I SAM-dependent methyltransferase [Rhodococcus sp. OK302]OYD61306.1 methyltransferase family protein [Rhodococcus sp. OK302]